MGDDPYVTFFKILSGALIVLILQWCLFFFIRHHHFYLLFYIHKILLFLFLKELHNLYYKSTISVFAESNQAG